MNGGRYIELHGREYRALRLAIEFVGGAYALSDDLMQERLGPERLHVRIDSPEQVRQHLTIQSG